MWTGLSVLTRSSMMISPSATRGKLWNLQKPYLGIYPENSFSYSCAWRLRFSRRLLPVISLRSQEHPDSRQGVNKPSSQNIWWAVMAEYKFSFIISYAYMSLSHFGARWPFVIVSPSPGSTFYFWLLSAENVKTGWKLQINLKHVYNDTGGNLLVMHLKRWIADS